MVRSFFFLLLLVFTECKSVLVSFLKHQSGNGNGRRRSSEGGCSSSGLPIQSLTFVNGKDGDRKPTHAMVLVLLLRLRQTCSHLSLLAVSLALVWVAILRMLILQRMYIKHT